MNDACQLDGLAVLVTRPQHQSVHFCQLLEAAGGKALRYPVIEIVDIEDTSLLDRQIEKLDTFDYAIFISPNAAERAIANIGRCRDFPATIRRVAIGVKTARQLLKLGYPADIVPDNGYDSEALLAAPEMQSVAGKKVIIFRGGSGRELLAETLKSRAAYVQYADVYRRIRPTPAERLGKLLEKADVVAVTSNEGLQNLYAMADEMEQAELIKKPLLAGSRRVLELASRLGFRAIIINADNPSDSTMLNALCQWVQSGEHRSV